MATIVVHSKTKTEYLLMGSGLGIYQSDRNTDFHQSEGWYAMVSVCDNEGQIFWFEHDELRVASVDGQHPSAHLDKTPYR